MIFRGGANAAALAMCAGLWCLLVASAHGADPEETKASKTDSRAESFVFDAHNNLVVSLLRRKDVDVESIELDRFQHELHTDLPRLKQGGVGAEVFATYVTSDSIKKGSAVRETLEQIAKIKRLLERYPGTWELAVSCDDLERLRRERRIAAWIAIENGDAIDGSLAVLRSYYDAGVRCMALAHDDTHGWADSALDKSKHGGLSKFGEQVVAEMNRLGMVVDLSHASEETVRDALAVAKAPAIFSHSGVRAVGPHARNLPDDILQLVAKNGGVVHVNFFAGYLTKETVSAYEKRSKAAGELRKSYKSEEQFRLGLQQWLKEHPLPATTVADVVDHIDHVVKVAGIDHVGLGSSFDGVASLPRDLNDVSCFPRLTQELRKRGYSDADIRKILGENTLRVFREVERTGVAARAAAAKPRVAVKESN